MSDELDDDVLETLMRAAFHRDEPCAVGVALLDELVHSPGAEVEARAAAHLRTCPVCASAPGVADGLLAGELEIARHRGDLDQIARHLDRVLPELDAPVPDNVVTLHRGPKPAAAPRRAWVAWTPLLAAAVVMFAVGLAPRSGPGGLPDDLAPAGHTRGALVALTSPDGDLDAAPERLVWARVDGATGYAVRLERADGQLVWSDEVADVTEVVLPDAVRAGLERATRYGWSVTATAAGATVATSPPVTFRIVPR